MSRSLPLSGGKAASTLVRVVQGVLRHVPGEQLLLLRDVPSDGVPEGRVSYLVRAVGEGGEEAPRELVLALRAGLEELEAPLDGELDPLVVAELEVQISPRFDGAPVAPVERASLEEKQSARDRTPRRLVAREDEEDAVTHRPEDLGEERAGEVRESPLPVVRREVEPVHQGRVLRRERLPREPLDDETLTSELPALALDLAPALPL